MGGTGLGKEKPEPRFYPSRRAAFREGGVKYRLAQSGLCPGACVCACMGPEPIP